MNVEFLAVAGLSIAGLGAGGAARVLLGRTPRGTSVRAGPLEVAVSVLWGLIGVSWASGGVPGWWAPTACVVAWVAVPLVVVDLRHRRLPDVLTLGVLPLLAVALAVAAVGGGGWGVVAGASVGVVAFVAVHVVVAAALPGALGGGDVKLAVPVGAVLGVLGPEALLLGLVGASVVTLGLLAVVPRWRREGAPHGPGMLGAACVLAVVAV